MVTKKSEKKSKKDIIKKPSLKKAPVSSRPKLKKATIEILTPEVPSAPIEEKQEIPEKPLETKQLGLNAQRKYFYGVGRRKESTAKVKLLTRGNSQITVNGKTLEQYFLYPEWREKVLSPLVAVGQLKNLDVEAAVHGGGIAGQAEAVRHAVARALLKLNPVFRKSLRKNGYLTRDPRMKERKKYGLKRARRAPQWSKR